jgi:hypothetical protein
MYLGVVIPCTLDERDRLYLEGHSLIPAADNAAESLTDAL